MSNPNPADVKAEKKERYFEPAPQDIDVENFKKVIQSRRSVRKFTDKAIPAEVLDDCLDITIFLNFLMIDSSLQNMGANKEKTTFSQDECGLKRLVYLK